MKKQTVYRHISSVPQYIIILPIYHQKKKLMRAAYHELLENKQYQIFFLVFGL